MRTGGRWTTIREMDVQHAVVWTGAGTDRFVGKLAMSDDELILDGTTTTPERRHGCVRIPRLDIRGATAERVDGATAIRIVALRRTCTLSSRCREGADRRSPWSPS